MLFVLIMYLLTHFTFRFHGLIARAEAAEILCSHQDGCFLVREASSGKQISLSHVRKEGHYLVVSHI